LITGRLRIRSPEFQSATDLVAQSGSLVHARILHALPFKLLRIEGMVQF